MVTGSFKSQVDKIWNTFWTGGISNPLTVIEQFTYLLFIRRLDEIKQLKEKQATITKTPIKDSVYQEKFYPFRWSRFKDLDPENMFELFTKPSIDGMTIFDHMKTNGHDGGVFGEFMKGATREAITKKQLAEFEIPLPPLPLQNQFAERVQAIEEQKVKAQVSLEKAEELFQSLLQKAFRGEIN